MSYDPIVFNDLSAVEIPVTLGGESYKLCEASGDAACRYRNALLECTELVDGKPSRIRGMADVEPLLVSFCLFNAEGNPVGLNTIRTWPNRVQKRLFEEVKKISNLDEDVDRKSLVKQRDELNKQIAELDEETAKNSPSDTTDGLR